MSVPGEREAIAQAVLDSEAFMWLMAGANHAEAHIAALRPAYERYRSLGGGFNAPTASGNSTQEADRG